MLIRTKIQGQYSTTIYDTPINAFKKAIKLTENTGCILNLPKLLDVVTKNAFIDHLTDYTSMTSFVIGKYRGKSRISFIHEDDFLTPERLNEAQKNNDFFYDKKTKISGIELSQYEFNNFFENRTSSPLLLDKISSVRSGNYSYADLENNLFLSELIGVSKLDFFNYAKCGESIGLHVNNPFENFSTRKNIFGLMALTNLPHLDFYTSNLTENNQINLVLDMKNTWKDTERREIAFEAVYSLIQQYVPPTLHNDCYADMNNYFRKLNREMPDKQ